MAVKALMTDETGKQIVDAIREKAGLEARVSDLEKNKVDKSSISQTTGDAEDKVMSQAAATKELGELGKEIINKVDEVIKNSDGVLPSWSPIPETAFLTGKYISTSKGGVWNSELIDSSSSVYTPESIDVSAYIGGKIKITLSELNEAGTRSLGFCDSNGVVSMSYLEREMKPPLAVHNPVSGLYEAFLDVTDTRFFFSFKANCLVKIELISPRNVYRKDEVDEYVLEIEQALAKTAEAVKVYSDEQRDAVRAETDEKVNRLKAKDVMIDKRLENIEQGLPADRWAVDDGVAYIKDVPENALPFASVDLIGGMTRKCANLLDVDGIDFENEIKTGEIHGKEVDAVYKENTQYCFTCRTTNKTEGLSGHILYLRVYYTDGTNNGYTPIANSTDNNTFKQVVTEKGKTVQRMMFQYAVSATVTIDDAMLNEGTEPHPYEPYFDGLRSAPVTEVESVGVNLIPFPYYDGGAGTVKEMNGATFTVNADGSITINGTPTGTAYFRLSNGIEWVTTSISADSVAKNADGKTFFNCRYNASNTLLTVNLSTGTTYTNTVVHPTINSGDTALPYTPYRRNTLPIPAEVQALDGYGWGVNDEVYNYVDWEKKQFVKRIGCVDLGTLNWAKYTDNQFQAGGQIGIKTPYVTNHICSKYETSPRGAYDRKIDKTISLGGSIWVYDSEYNDVTTFKAAMSGVMLYYELAEPVITDISDLLPDDNLIGVEGGGTVTMVNEYGYDVPSEITYQLKGAEA